MLKYEKLVTIGLFANALEANLVAGHLQNAGIPVIVSDDSTSLSRMGYIPCGGVRVRVRLEDADEARRLLREAEGVDEETILDEVEDEGETNDVEPSLVCPLCASSGLQSHRRWWVMPFALLPLLLWPVKPVAAVAFTVALLAAWGLMPPACFCTKCRNVVRGKQA